MRRRWAAFLLALAVVGVPSWLAVQLAGATAPARGLILDRVFYDPEALD